MAASPIEAFIRSHEGDSFEVAFEAFLGTPKIQTWVGDDETRIARLRDEFKRAWQRVNPPEPKDYPETFRPLSRSGAHAAAQEGSAGLEKREVRSPPPAPERRAPESPAEPMRRVPVQDPKNKKAARPPEARNVGAQLAAARSVMCPACHSLDLHAHLANDVVKVRCARCRAVYADLFECIPVREVGPFAYLFGDGWKGALNFVLLVAFLLASYGVLRWVL